LEYEVQQGIRLTGGEGWDLYATDDPDLALLAFADGYACELAHQLHLMLQRHALSTSLIRRLDSHRLLVRRLELLPLTVVAEATDHEATVRFVDEAGAALNREALRQMPGLTRARPESVADTALHAVRCLRAYLTPLTPGLSLRLRFGIDAGGACVLAVPNPLECGWGRSVFASLCDRLARPLT
jgi:hypothetical protein